MRRCSAILLIPVLLCGCVLHRTVEETFDFNENTYDRTTFVGIAWLNRTAVRGLTVGKRTSGGSTTLSLNQGSTETQTEAIKAAGEAIGAGIAEAMRKTVVP